MYQSEPLKDCQLSSAQLSSHNSKAVKQTSKLLQVNSDAGDGSGSVSGGGGGKCVTDKLILFVDLLTVFNKRYRGDNKNLR